MSVRRRIKATLFHARQAAQRESLLIVILQLLITAGPVTYIALNLGYRIGFGTPPPTALFFHIAVFTVVAGTAAFLFSLFHKATQEPRLAEEQQRLADSVSLLAEAVFDLRDLTISTLPKEEQVRYGALFILQNPHASEVAIEQAVFDLTNDGKLAQQARQIEIYRRHGLKTLQQRLATQTADAFMCSERRKQLSTDEQGALELRLRGMVRPISHGRPRPEGFIERVLLAGETNDHSVMSGYDAMAMLALAFEFLGGREITYLQPHLRGNSELASAQNQLAQARARYRHIRLKRNSILRALAEVLRSASISEESLSGTAQLEQLVYSINTIFTEHAAVVQQAVKTRGKSTENVQQSLKYLTSGMQYYRRLWQADINLTRASVALDKAEKRFMAIYQSQAAAFPWRFVSGRTFHAGIAIQPTEIALSERQRVLLAHRIRARCMAMKDGEHTLAAFKMLATDIALLLDEYLPLTQQNIQHAIESTNAVQVTAIDPSHTAQIRANIAASLILELVPDRQKAAHRLAQSLLQAYGARLDNTALEFLVKKYDADYSTLHQLVEIYGAGTAPAFSSLASSPVVLQPWHRTIEPLLEKAGKRLKGQSI